MMPLTLKLEVAHSSVTATLVIGQLRAALARLGSDDDAAWFAAKAAGLALDPASWDVAPTRNHDGTLLLAVHPGDVLAAFARHLAFGRLDLARQVVVSHVPHREAPG